MGGGAGRVWNQTTGWLVVAVMGGAAVVFGLLRAGAAGAADDADPPSGIAALADSDSQSEEPALPLTALPVVAAKVELGRALFSDARLSRDGTLSCSSCHVLALGGADGLALSRGVGGRLGAANTPTVYNSAYNFRQFWDGRARSLEEQIDGPVQNGVEMATSWPAILATLQQTDYALRFRVVYRDGLTAANIKSALAEYERSLVTTGSRFDRFLRGDAAVLNAEEKRGYELFKSHGCVSCHQGANVGGNMFETLGVMGDYFGDRGHVTEVDFGRYNVTRREEDRFKFKVPSLRLVTLTAPYFHDGSAATLDQAIDVMARYQLGYRLSPADRRSIIVFLGTMVPESFVGARHALR